MPLLERFDVDFLCESPADRPVSARRRAGNSSSNCRFEPFVERFHLGRRAAVARRTANVGFIVEPTAERAVESVRSLSSTVVVVSPVERAANAAEEFQRDFEHSLRSLVEPVDVSMLAEVAGQVVRDDQLAASNLVSTLGETDRRRFLFEPARRLSADFPVAIANRLRKRFVRAELFVEFERFLDVERRILLVESARHAAASETERVRPMDVSQLAPKPLDRRSRAENSFSTLLSVGSSRKFERRFRLATDINRSNRSIKVSVRWRSVDARATRRPSQRLLHLFDASTVERFGSVSMRVSNEHFARIRSVSDAQSNESLGQISDVRLASSARRIPIRRRRFPHRSDRRRAGEVSADDRRDFHLRLSSRRFDSSDSRRFSSSTAISKRLDASPLDRRRVVSFVEPLVVLRGQRNHRDDARVAVVARRLFRSSTTAPHHHLRTSQPANETARTAFGHDRVSFRLDLPDSSLSPTETFPPRRQTTRRTSRPLHPTDRRDQRFQCEIDVLQSVQPSGDRRLERQRSVVAAQTAVLPHVAAGELRDTMFF